MKKISLSVIATMICALVVSFASCNQPTTPETPAKPEKPEKPETPQKTEEEINKEKIKLFEESFVKALKGTTLHVTKFAATPNANGDITLLKLGTINEKTGNGKAFVDLAPSVNGQENNSLNFDYAIKELTTAEDGKTSVASFVVKNIKSTDNKKYLQPGVYFVVYEKDTKTYKLLYGTCELMGIFSTKTTDKITDKPIYKFNDIALYDTIFISLLTNEKYFTAKMINELMTRGERVTINNNVLTIGDKTAKYSLNFLPISRDAGRIVNPVNIIINDSNIIGLENGTYSLNLMGDHTGPETLDIHIHFGIGQEVKLFLMSDNVLTFIENQL